jgi:hypothetical protein
MQNCLEGSNRLGTYGHNNNSGTKSLNDLGLLDEISFTFLEGDGVDNTFALSTLQTGFNDSEVGRIHHKRNLEKNEWLRLMLGNAK